MNRETKNYFSQFENTPHEEKLQKASDIFIKETQEDKLITSLTNRNNQILNSNQEILKNSIDSKLKSAIINNGPTALSHNTNLDIVNNVSSSRNNNLRETALEFNPISSNNNNPAEIESFPLDSIHIDDPRTNLESENNEEEIKKSKSILKSCIGILINCLALCFIFFFYFEIEFGKEILFIFITTFQILSAMFTLVKKDKENKKFFIVERINFVFVTALVFLKIELDSFKFMFCILTIPLVHLIYWIKKSKEKHSYISANFAIRMLFFVQTLQIALRIDGYITWDWNLVFWIFWMVAIMSIFYVMGLSILLILTLYYKYFGQAENFQIIGLVWCFSNISNFVMGLCLILKGVLNIVTKDEINMMRNSLIITQTWITFNIFYSYGCHNQIINFINVLLYDKETLETEGEIDQMEQGKKQKVIYNIETTDKLPEDMPHFLMKFSSTYFQNSEITKEILNKLIGGKKSSNKKKKPKSKQSLKKFEKKNFEKDLENASLSNEKMAENNLKKLRKISIPTDLTESKKSNKSEKSESDKVTNTKDMKNESVLHQSILNESEITPDLNKSINQSILNQSHNFSINQSLNQSVVSCLVCYEKLPDAVLMECGHGGLCYDCALDIWKKNGECYLCRKDITKIYQIDLKGGTGQYKPIIKLTNLKKEMVDVTVVENENEEAQNHENEDDSVNNEQERHVPHEEQNISHNESNVEDDNQILQYLDQQQP